MHATGFRLILNEKHPGMLLNFNTMLTKGLLMLQCLDQCCNEKIRKGKGNTSGMEKKASLYRTTLN